MTKIQVKRHKPADRAAKHSDLRATVRDYLRWKGWLVFHNLQGVGCHKGLTDLVAVKMDRCFFLEIKTGRATLNEHQKEFKRQIEAHGGEHVRFLTVRGLEDLKPLEAY